VRAVVYPLQLEGDAGFVPLGVHLVVWFNDLRPRDIDAVLARAARAGVAVYSITPAYALAQPRGGLLFGYAAMTEAEIRAGIKRLADAL